MKKMGWIFFESCGVTTVITHNCSFLCRSGIRTNGFAAITADELIT